MAVLGPLDAAEASQSKAERFPGVFVFATDDDEHELAVDLADPEQDVKIVNFYDKGWHDCHAQGQNLTETLLAIDNSTLTIAEDP